MKKASEKVGAALYWIVIGYLTVRFVSGKVGILTFFILMLSYEYLLVRVLYGISDLIFNHKVYRAFKKEFLCFKTICEKGDKLYIENAGKSLFRNANELYSNVYLSRRTREKINAILDTTHKMLIETIQ